MWGNVSVVNITVERMTLSYCVFVLEITPVMFAYVLVLLSLLSKLIVYIFSMWLLKLSH